MANWRKQQGASHHQVGQRNRSYSRKPPLDRWQETVPSWEKKYCATIGLVPWRKVVETKKYMYLHDNVVRWDDSAGKEAFDNAKRRFWAEINGLPCNISLPDPDMYIDDIDWNSSVDPELLLDLEREPPPSEEANDEVVILGSSHLLNQSFFCTGWGEAEADLLPTVWEDSDVNANSRVDYCTGRGEAERCLPKDTIPVPPTTGWEDTNLNVNSGATGWGEAEKDPPKDTIPFPPPQGWNSDLNVYGRVDYSTRWGEAETNLSKATSNMFPAPQDWESNLQVNTGVGSWEQYCVPQEPGKVYEWQNYGNDSWQWNETQQSDFQKIGRGRVSGNWGSWDGYDLRRENMTWNKTNAYHGNENQMVGRGRRNNRGRKRGGFAYGRPYVDNMATARWEVKIK